jgi:ATP-dependent DNA helicase RecQ
MVSAGFEATALREALYLFDRLGISSNDTGMTAFLHVGVENASKKRFEAACALETALIAQLRETAPDAIAGDGYPLNLRLLAQRLKDEGHAQACPRPWPDPQGLGRWPTTMVRTGAAASRSSVATIRNRIRRAQPQLGCAGQTAERRRTAAGLLLAHWLSCLPGGTRGIDLLAETTLGKLAASVAGDALLATENGHIDKLVDRALLWLHEQDILRLNKGLAVFRTAMTLQLESNWKLH